MDRVKLALLLILAALYGAMIAEIGFLSDDLTLLSRFEQSNTLFSPLEKHHYSLLINIYFAIASPLLFHVTAIVLHFINTLLAYRFAAELLALPKDCAFTASLFFAINPAGIEALAWCCALPYVATATLTLTSMLYYGRYLEKKNRYPSLPLALLFFIALAIWEWSLLILPLLLLTAIFIPSKYQWKEKLMPLLPLILLTIAYFFLRSRLQLETGYRQNDLLQGASILASSPLITLIPYLSKEFYKTPLALFAATLLLASLLAASARSRKVAFLFALFTAALMPAALLGHPQSRYYYLAALPLYTIVAMAISSATKQSTARLVTTCALASLFLSLAVIQLESWREASRHKDFIISAIDKVVAAAENPIIIDNLPEAYGEEGRIWRPHLFRCGLELFKGKVVKEMNAPYPLYHLTFSEEGYKLVEISR